MNGDFEQLVRDWAGWLASFVLGGWHAARWWYALRKLDRVDKDETELSSSIRWMLQELRAEVARVHSENTALRQRLAILEASKE